MDSKEVKRPMRRILLIFFIIALILLTLFSNTLQNVRLPAVVTAAPSTERLKITIEGKGILRIAKPNEVKNENGLKLVRITVKEGERVQKGDIIAEYNTGAMERQIRDAELQLQKSKIQSSKLEEQFIQANISGDELQIREANRALELDRIDQQLQSQKLADMKLDLNEQKYERASIDGIVAEVKASTEDMPSPGQTVVVLMKEEEGYEFSFTIPEHKAAWLEEGESIDVQLGGEENSSISGVVHSLNIGDSGVSSPESSPAGSDYNGRGSTAGASVAVTIQVPATAQDNKLESGMKAKVSIEKSAEQSGFLVQTKWLNQDMEGTFLYLVKETLGAFGNEFIVYKTTVNVLADDGDYSLVQGLTSKDNIIIETSEPLREGNRVRVK